jgi:hypothetical protein
VAIGIASAIVTGYDPLTTVFQGESAIIVNVFSHEIYMSFKLPNYGYVKVAPLVE